MQETENTEGTVTFKRMEFDTREWSAEKVEKLCERLESDGYVYEDKRRKGLSSLSACEDGIYRLYDQYVADKDFLTTYEEYMGDEVKGSREPMREVVLTHDTVSIDNVTELNLYGVLGDERKRIIYQVSGVYSFSVLDALNANKLYSFKSLEEVIKCCLCKGWKVYEFDNSEDLLRWLLEK